MQHIMKQEGFEFSFDPQKCLSCEGNCCIGESGYIWCNPKEIDDMASFFDLSYQDFVHQYIRKVGFKSSLKEIQIGQSYSCIFFDLGKKACKIYQVRPYQCRTFPFWEYFKNNIKEVQKECPGIII